MHVVICGGGIIGASVAYYLSSQHGVRCTVVDRDSPACAASGKAGGFLALDWCDGSELGPLARLSFDLHAKLAELFPNCDYRRMDTLSVQVTEGGVGASSGRSRLLPDWLDGSVSRVSRLGTTENTAQVHPFKLTHAMLDAAKSQTATSVQQAVISSIAVTNGRAVGVITDSGETIAGDAVVVTMGPWSSQAGNWFPGFDVPITGSPVHSIILEASVTGHALFTTYRQHAKNLEPEIYPRPDGTVYVCGRGAKPALPDDPQAIQSNEQDAAMLHNVARCASSTLGQAKLVASNCCYLPSTPDGIPMIGKIPGCEGAYIAAGHSCWGILEAPATGACLAELIVNGKCSLVDLKPFDPARFSKS